ncbi:uncharacterized protein LOC128258256 [Drosophila gunungcola]|nr:uncharacterized protein LOC108150325 [Drosophila elegans]XP_052845739.1 uncharacterized protein LOC128258256 [Drosophila gunungcola]
MDEVFSLHMDRLDVYDVLLLAGILSVIILICI